MSRRVVITGLGPITALGLGVEALWRGMVEGRSALRRIEAFDPAGFSSQIGGEVRGLDIREFVPKSYRKATKVMARDIELAVAAADFAAKDAQLVTRGTHPDAAPSYPPPRVGCQIGAGLIAADLDELTAALVEARASEGPQAGSFDIHKWGREGMSHLTPLWLLKYLPNMLACHVTIIHDTQGPSNTITCGEASAGLSLGEALRVIGRHAADMCFCGGAESKMNPAVFLRQVFSDRLTTRGNDHPETAVRPFALDASGTAAAEGGGILVLEAWDTFRQRRDAATGTKPRAYAEVTGFGAAQSVNPARDHLTPHPEGRALANAVLTALRTAGLDPAQIDLIVPMGLGTPESDLAEVTAYRRVFGERLAQIPLASTKPYVGNCAAGAGGVDLCLAARAIAEQTIPARINCSRPMPGVLAGDAPATRASLRHALCVGTGVGGQVAATVLSAPTEA